MDIEELVLVGHRQRLNVIGTCAYMYMSITCVLLFFFLVMHNTIVYLVFAIILQMYKLLVKFVPFKSPHIFC